MPASHHSALCWVGGRGYRAIIQQHVGCRGAAMSVTVGTKAAITTSMHLYKYLMRLVKKLPESTQPYYYNQVKQNFRSHSDEIHPERIQQIITRALEDAEWVLNKYAKPSE